MDVRGKADGVVGQFLVSFRIPHTNLAVQMLRPLQSSAEMSVDQANWALIWPLVTAAPAISRVW